MQILDEIARELKKQQSRDISNALFGTGLVLGTITPTMKVKLDNFKHEVDFLRIQTSNWLEPGDRVLVAIVNNGSDHVVIGKVI